MITMLIISMVLVVLYTGTTIYYTKQIPDSVSAMVYAFPICRWLWTIWIWFVGFLIVPSLIETLDDSFKFLGFGTVAMLLFCGAMPLFEKDSNALHNFFGAGAGILSQLCVALINPWWLMVWIAWVMMFIWKTKEQSISNWKWSIFLAESVCYVSLIGSLITH